MVIGMLQAVGVRLRGQTAPRPGWAGLAVRVLAAAGLTAMAMATAALAQGAPSGPIEKLLADGWEIAGYVAAWENRTLILFKHKDHRFLMQCSVLVDVTRQPAVLTICRELR